MQTVWVRTCQECGHEQESKCPADYKGVNWTELRCKKCKSLGMNYGKKMNKNENGEFRSISFEDDES